MVGKLMLSFSRLIREPRKGTCSAAQARSYKPLQLAIDDAVELICASPEVGEGKAGDLAGIRVYKFRFSRQEYLVAYRPPEQDVPLEFLIIDFYQVGLHENFYAELKQYLRQESRKGAAK